MPKINLLIVPTYNWPSDEPPAGQTNGTKARIRRACELVDKGKIPRDCIMPFPQMEQKTAKHGRLGEETADYARAQLELAEMTIRTEPHAARPGTWDDQLTSYQIGLNVADHDPVHVHFVSDLVHLVRIMLIWFFTKPRGWTASFHLVKNFRPVPDILQHEPGSFAKVLLLGIRYKISQ